MSVVKGNKKETINFSEIPLCIKDQILEKMNFKTYATYMMTGREAGALSARNEKFIYPMSVYRMTIKGDKMSFVDRLQIEMIPFEMCAKMKLTSQIVAVQDLSLSIKTCDFLLKLEEIPTFECTFLEGIVPHIADFFKKAKIQTLKMSMVKSVDATFDYDTNNIEKVEIYNKKSFTPPDIFPIKARRTLTLTSMQISPNQIYHFLVELIRGSEKPVLILKNCDIDKDAWIEFLDTLKRNFTSHGKSTFVSNIRGRPLVNVDIQSFVAPYSLKIQVL